MEREENKRKMIKTLENDLPEFVKMVKTSKESIIVIHQDSFAIDYQTEEFYLFGMAIKFAGIYNKEIRIIGDAKS